jgi:Zn-dependent protease with chaperone function
MKYCIGVVFVFQFVLAHAQFEKTYSPAIYLDTIPTEVSDSLKARLARQKKRITGKTTVRNFTYSLYEKHNESLVQFFNEDYFIQDDELTDYLHRVLQKVIRFNPQIKGDISIYAFRSSVPNAFTFWDGTIGVTLGLLARMENEDELAFVICHELAHYYAQHVDKRIAEIARINYDPQIEKEIKSIRSDQFEKYSKLKKLFKDLGLSLSHHNRGEEFQADSIGLTFMLRTDYRPQASLRLMEILDSANAPRYKKLIDIRKAFTLTKYPFKEAWLDYQKSVMYHKTGDEDFGDSDTVRTHPDCKRRIVALKEILRANQLSTERIPLNTDATIRSIATRSEFEMVDTENHYKHYGKSLFYALALLQKYPGNFYLTGMVGRNLSQIYQSMKAHQFGKVVSFPDDRFEENYNRVLSFLQKLRIMEAAALAYYYMVEKEEIYFHDEEFLFSFWYASQMPMSDLSANLVKDDYLQRFPNGKYTSILNQKK